MHARSIPDAEHNEALDLNLFSSHERPQHRACHPCTADAGAGWTAVLEDGTELWVADNIQLLGMDNIREVRRGQ